MCIYIYVCLCRYVYIYIYGNPRIDREVRDLEISEETHIGFCCFCPSSWLANSPENPFCMARVHIPQFDSKSVTTRSFRNLQFSPSPIDHHLPCGEAPLFTNVKRASLELPSTIRVLSTRDTASGNMRKIKG